MDDREYARFDAERQRVMSSPERQAEVLALAVEIGVVSASDLRTPPNDDPKGDV